MNKFKVGDKVTVIATPEQLNTEMFLVCGCNSLSGAEVTIISSAGVDKWFILGSGGGTKLWIYTKYLKHNYIINEQQLLFDLV